MTEASSATAAGASSIQKEEEVGCGAFRSPRDGKGRRAVANDRWELRKMVHRVAAAGLGYFASPVEGLLHMTVGE